MYLIRDVFRCRPGGSGELARRLERVLGTLERDDGFRNCRVLVDAVATYWTVVLEAETDDLARFEHHMASFSARPEVREALEGYHELVAEGHREIFRIV